MAVCPWPRGFLPANSGEKCLLHPPRGGAQMRKCPPGVGDRFDPGERLCSQSRAGNTVLEGQSLWACSEQGQGMAVESQGFMGPSGSLGAPLPHMALRLTWAGGKDPCKGGSPS